MATLAQKRNTPKKVFSFRWHGFNRKGQKVSGEFQADSINTVKAELRKQGVNVTKVSKQGQGLFSKGGARIKPMDIAVISRQITTMLSAGVPLVQSLQIIARGHEKAAVRELIGQIAADVETGTPLSEALRRHPRHFDDLYCDLVEAGEQSGALETIYDRIAIYREKNEALKSKIKKAMFYPSMVILVAIVVTSILLLFVIPQFEDIFKSFGAELPAPAARFLSLLGMAATPCALVSIGLFLAHKHEGRQDGATGLVLAKLLLQPAITSADALTSAAAAKIRARSASQISTGSATVVCRSWLLQPIASAKPTRCVMCTHLAAFLNRTGAKTA